MSDITVLAVDDSELILEMLKDYLAQASYKVITAGNGEEGLRVLGQVKPDVIVSDIIMPVMDGWQFCEAIRKNPDTTSIPFLFLTSEKEVPKRIRGLKLGADDYLTKPFSRTELLARMSRIVEKVTSARQDFGRQRAALAGHTSHLAMADLLQLLSLNGKTGVLRLERDGQGRIYFRNGRIIHARLGGAQGAKALFRLLAWQDAHFELEPLEEAGVEETITESTQNVLMEGFTQIDEARRLAGRLPAAHERLCARIPASAELTPEERRVLDAVGEGCAYGDLLERVDLTDFKVMEAVAALRDRGVLVAPELAGAAR